MFQAFPLLATPKKRTRGPWAVSAQQGHPRRPGADVGWSTEMRGPQTRGAKLSTLSWQRSSGEASETVEGEGSAKLRWTLNHRRRRTRKVPQTAERTSLRRCAS